MLDEANEYIRINKDKVNPQYRLVYHLMGQCGWINDPNGFICYKNQYHLFYQHYPFDTVPGPMYWGHAVSDDLIKWDYLPLALAPDKSYDKSGCFSGSAIETYDKLYLMYTGHVVDEDGQREMQCLAYSADAVHFTKYEGNPVIGQDMVPACASKKDFRDPKVFKRNGKYYAVIGSNDGKGHGQVLTYSSLDMYKWQFLAASGAENGLGNNWECPDLFAISGKDVLIVSIQYIGGAEPFNKSMYAVGSFDEASGKFKFENCLPLDYGFDFYAPQTAEDKNGRRVMVAWMHDWGSENPTRDLGHNWAGAMTLPREISLKGDKLVFSPPAETRFHRDNEFFIKDMVLEGEQQLDTYGESYEIEAVFEACNASEFGLKLRTGIGEETVLAYDAAKKAFVFDRERSGIGPKGCREADVELDGGKLYLRVFVDKCSIEAFIGDGQKVMTGRIYPSKGSTGIKVFARGQCKVLSLKKWDINV